MPTEQEIQALQGTRNQAANPWDTYSDELDLKLSPEMEAAVAEYATHRYEDAPVSSQTQEQLAEIKEGNEAMSQEYQWVTPEEYDDELARIGTPTLHTDFLNKLNSIRNGVNWLYLTHPHPDKAILAYTKDGGELQVAAWVQIGYMQELSVLHFDEYGVPGAEKRRGWRTPLLQILLKELITEKEANKVFGKPKQTDAFARYNRTLFEWRKRSNGWEE